MRRAVKYIIYAYVAAMSCVFICSIIANSLNERDPFTICLFLFLLLLLFILSILWKKPEKERKHEQMETI